MSDSTSAARLGRDAIVYGIAFLAARAASFIMLPIYTQYLAPADYATLHLLQMSLEVAAILLSAGVTAGVHRYYFKVTTDDERHAVLWCSLLMFEALNIMGSLALWIFSDDIAHAVLEDHHQGPLVTITAVSFGLEAFTTVPMLLLQIRQRAGWYAGVATARLVLQLSLNILFLVVLDMGVRGLLISTLITYATGGLSLLAWFAWTTPLRLNRVLAWDLWKFGLPYRLTSAGTFILTYVDRYFLTRERGLDEVGVYSLAYQFGFLMMYLGPAPFHLAWDPQRFQLVKQSAAERNAAYAKGHFYFSVLLVTLAVGVSIYVEPVIRLMANGSYHWAANVVPIILLAFMCQAWGHVEEFGIQVSERTVWTTVGTWIAVAVIIVGYMLLIPPYGAYGAAIATVLAYATRWAVFRFFAQRLFPVDYKPARGLAIGLVGCAVVVGWFLLRPEHPFAQLAAATLVSLVWVAGIWWGILRGEERAAAMALARPFVWMLMRKRRS